MDYRGVECPVCKKRFEENDDIVVCPECGTPHHRGCWFSVSHCVNEEKHPQGFVFELPRIKQIENQILSGEAFNDDEPEFSSPDEEAAYYSARDGEKSDDGDAPDFKAPILGGMGQMGLNFGSNPTVADIPLEEVIAFVGEDSFSSKLVFKLALIDRLKSLRFNFVAFFFPYVWLFYRKMYKLGALVMAVMLIVTLAFTNSNTIKYQQKMFELYMQAAQGQITVEEYNAAMLDLQEKGTGNGAFYETAPQAINLAIRIFFAFMANKFYLEHMKKQVFKTREECSSMDEYMSALKRKGGKSAAAAILSVLAFGVLNTGLVAVLYAVLMR